MTTNRPRTPVDELIDAALARQRAQLAAQLRDRVLATPGDDPMATGIRLGLTIAADWVERGRTVDVPR